MPQLPLGKRDANVMLRAIDIALDSDFEIIADNIDTNARAMIKRRIARLRKIESAIRSLF